MREINRPAYPAGSVTDLIGGPLLTPPTSAALRDRAAPVLPPATQVLTGAQMTTLRAVAARLVPQDRAEPIDLAARLHRRLADGRGDGWRYAALPPDAEMVARGLDALASAGFDGLDGTGQHRMLTGVQSGSVAGWPFPAARWFEEVLTMLVDLYYSHPLAQEEIGYAGMADARGWPEVGFGARRDFEPEPV